MQPRAAGENDIPTCTAPKPVGVTRPSTLPPGMPVGDYVIERLIGVGGCGVVYMARHRQLHRIAAIKVLHRSLAVKSKMVERFVREAEVVNLLEHPNIAAIFELEKLEDGRPYCVMEHLSGITLDALLRAKGRLSPDEALDILAPVCEALHAAHDAGIVHRDVKPNNIMICGDGAARSVKLLDFGIAKLMDPELETGLTSAGQCLGTIGAMAPEQILCAPVDSRADVYALGVLLYRLLTGRAPFFSVDAAEIAMHHLETPPPRPSLLAPVSPAMDAVVLRGMEKRPDDRFESARAFLSALKEAVGRAADGREDNVIEDALAVAIYVELGFNADLDGLDELDDALAADLGRALDGSEERLRSEGFTLVLATGTAVLAARQLSTAPDEMRRERGAALLCAASLYRALKARPSAEARVGVAVCVHVDGATVRASPRARVTGGPVTNMTLWALPEGARGLYVTPEATNDLSGAEVLEVLDGLDPPAKRLDLRRGRRG